MFPAPAITTVAGLLVTTTVAWFPATMTVAWLQKYLGEYVAVYNEERVDHDPGSGGFVLAN